MPMSGPSPNASKSSVAAGPSGVTVTPGHTSPSCVSVVGVTVAWTVVSTSLKGPASATTQYVPGGSARTVNTPSEVAPVADTQRRSATVDTHGESRRATKALPPVAGVARTVTSLGDAIVSR